MTLRILHLYPAELGINGDAGNVLAMQRRAEWRDLEVEVLGHNPGDSLPKDVHLVHIGSGPLAGQTAVRDDLQAIAGDLRGWKAADVPFLAIAGGWQLLGRSLRDADGAELPAAGVFASDTVLTSARFVGEIVLDTPLGRVAGFENHGSVTTLLDGVPALGTVVRRTSAAPATAEGILDGASIGTNLHGPFLPMNPMWADRLLAAALTAAGEQSDLPSAERADAADVAAEQSRAAIARRLGCA